MVDGIRPETLEGIRRQAELQLHFRETGEHRVDDLPDEEDRGYRLLPAPDFGDVWLDLEGHPFYEPARGLEYLFGWCYRDEDGAVRYEAAWARDRDGEREIFERFVDWVVERRRRYPGAHVYHYAAYERTALRRLMGEHGTREQRGRRLPAPRRARRPLPRRQAGAPRVGGELLDQGDRGAVRVRAHGRGHGRRRVDRPLRDSGSRPATTRSCGRSRPTTRRTAARRSRSTSGFCERRPPELPWRPPPEDRERSEEAEERDAARAALHAALLADAEEGDPRWLLAHLLDYHRARRSPQWWEWFHHLALDEEELIEDTDTIGGLELVGEPERGQAVARLHVLVPDRRSTRSGRLGVDPATEKTVQGRRSTTSRA